MIRVVAGVLTVLIVLIVLYLVKKYTGGGCKCNQTQNLGETGMVNTDDVNGILLPRISL